MGRVLVLTGEGKGKTTAAMGYAVRMAAEGKKAVVAQFLKGGGYTGELVSAEYFLPMLVIRQFGYGCPCADERKNGTADCRKCGTCFRENRNPERGYVPEAMAFAAAELAKAPAVVVLDEVSHAIRHGLVDMGTVINLVAGRPTITDMILTGRGMPEEIIAIADEASYCRAVRHPIQDGVSARRGIEY